MLKTKICFILLAFFMVGSYLSQKSKLDSLLSKFAVSKEDTNKINTGLKIGRELMGKGELDKAFSYFESGQKLSQKLNFSRGLGNALTLMGRVYKRKNNLELALQSYSLALQTREKSGNKLEVCNSLNEIGTIFKKMGDFTRAFESFTKAYKLSEEINFSQGVADNLMSIGILHSKQGDYPMALKYYLQSLPVYEKLNDKDNIGRLLLNIGSNYDILGEYNKALEYLQRALKIKLETGEMEGLANMYSCLANVYFGTKDYKSCLEYYNKGLEIAEKLNEKIIAADIMNNIGNVYFVTGKHEKALDIFLTSLKKREGLKDLTGQAESFHQIATVFYELKKYNEGLVWAKKSIALLKEMDNPELLKDVQKNLSLIYESKKDGLNALKYYKEYISIRDTLFNKENTKKIVETQMNYEFDKKEAELKLAQDKKDFLLKEESEKQKIIRNSFVLGFALMIALAFFIFRGYVQKKKSNTEILHQKETIEEKQKEILDSINYAKRIQYTLLAHADFLKANIPNHFVYFNPKDIVSGDFYWAAKKGDKFYLAVCDSTGHGVPGAFMSLLNIGFLSEAINEKGIEKPNEVLNFVRQRLIDNISKEGQKDGFDGILICMDQKTKQITYSAANNKPILIQKDQIMELVADRMPVGMGERKKDFKCHTIDSKPGDSLYLYTDGFADQFGGPKGKKFKYKSLNELILTNSAMPLGEQAKVLKSSFDEWKANLEQVDDVCLIGIKL